MIYDTLIGARPAARLLGGRHLDEGADVNLKRWMAAIVAALGLAACSGPTVGATVARVDNVILTQQALDQRVALVKATAQAGQPIPADQELERQFVDQFVRENLIL